MPFIGIFPPFAEIRSLMRNKKLNPALNFYRKTISHKFYLDGIYLYLYYYAVAHVPRGTTLLSLIPFMFLIDQLRSVTMFGDFCTDDTLESKFL